MSSYLVTAFKEELLKGTHAFGTDTFKLALYTSSAAFTSATTAYSATNEVSGTGYVAGGETLTGVTVTSSGTTGYVDFADVTWSSSTITARYGLIYNSSKSNKAVAVLDFTTNVTTTGLDFKIQWPAAGENSAIVRVD